MLDADDMLDIPELGFTIGEDGDLVDLPVRSSVARTPGTGLGSAMHSDAGASAKVRRDHEEGRQAGNEVSLTGFCPRFAPDLRQIALLCR